MNKAYASGYVFFVLALLLPSLVFAASAEKQIVEGESITVSDGGTLSVYDDDFMIRQSAEGDKIYVERLGSDDDKFIDLGKCGNLDLVRFCFDKSSGATIYVKLYALVPELEMEEGVADTNVFVGETNTLSVNITNTGEKDAKNAEFSVAIPKDIEITEVYNGMFVENGVLKWVGNISSDDTVSLSADFIAKNVYDNLVLTSKVKYNNLFSIVEFEDEITHDARQWIQLTYATDDTPYVGNPVTIDLSLLSNHTTSFTSVKTGYNTTMKLLKLKFTNNFTFVDQTGFSFENDKYLSWSAKMPFNKTSTFTLQIIPLETGTLTIPVEMSFFDVADNETVYDVDAYITLQIASPRLEIIPQLDDMLTVNSSSTTHFDIVLKNTDDELDMKNVVVVVENKNGVSQWSLETLGSHWQRTLEDFSFTASATDVRKSESATITVTYETDNFEGGSVVKTINYEIVPHEELVLIHNITRVDDTIYGITVLAENTGSLPASGVTLSEVIPEYMFIKGSAEGTIDELKAGHTDVIASYQLVAPNVNLSETHELKTEYQYTIDNTTKIFSKTENLSAMLLAVTKEERPSIISQTKDKIEQVFTSMHFFILFIVSIILLIAATAVVTTYKKQFSIDGISGIKTKQRLLDQRRRMLDIKGKALAPAMQNTTKMIGDMKNKLSFVKDEMKKRLPVIDEKRSGVQIRQDEIMREKLAIEEKIKELKEIENKLLYKHKQYEMEKAKLNAQENGLKQRFDQTKGMIDNLSRKFKQELDTDHQINIQRDKLNRAELTLLAKKHDLLEQGKDTISDERVNVLQEKVKLEHERNTIQEELYSLKNRREDIESAQDSLKKQHADVKKEQNVFDANKKALASALMSLQQQSENINKILEDSKHSEIAQLDDQDA